MRFLPDHSSFVRLLPGYARVVSFHLDWILDFGRRVVIGSVVFRVQSVEGRAHHLTLDTRDLVIRRVVGRKRTASAEQELPFKLSDPHAVLGQCLTISLEDIVAAEADIATVEVVVSYETRENSTALQWLTKEQTSSGRYPFLFSQCQAIHARSMMPCQDLCQVKAPYTATVLFPSPLTVLMSAVCRVDAIQPVPLGNAPANFDAATFGENAFWASQRFEQRVPIPAYLVAIAAGEIVGSPVGPRSTVWAEPSVLPLAAREFSDTDAILSTAEARCGPYRFGTFDLLVLPPSFPYGGMENPCLTFVTPTLIAGDKSQVAVVAHELAHSWSGNLVTNATWEHFWINEGLTVFTEAKLVETIFGEAAASIRKEEGWQHLVQDVERIGASHAFTKLCPDLEGGQDPDDAFSSVPYEKGAALFWFIESLVGADAMQQTVRSFFDAFAFQTVTSNDVREFFVRAHPMLDEGVDWSAWFHAPGLPAFKPPADPSHAQQAKELAKLWLSPIESTEAVVGSALSRQFLEWPSSKKCVFLNELLSASVPSSTSTEEGSASGCSSQDFLDETRMQSMNDVYWLCDANCEIRCLVAQLWLHRSAGRSAAAVRLTTTLLESQGRMKFTRPVYRAWFTVDPHAAQSTFVRLARTYHPICVKMLEKDLQLSPDQKEAAR